MTKLFESCDPKKYLSVDEYCKIVLNESMYSAEIAKALANKTENGHMRREICANCGETFGEHCGDIGKIPKCEEL
jgi:hypothetical protein